MKFKIAWPHPFFDMPDGQYGGGGNTSYRYYFYLCTHEACTVEDDAGKAALRALSKLERQLRDKIRVKYPVADFEDCFREDIAEKLGFGSGDDYDEIPLFLVIMPKVLADFHPDVHRFALIDLSEFLNAGQFNAIGFGMRLSSLRKLLENDRNLFDVLHQEASKKKKKTWSGAFEAKPGIAGFKINLIELFRLMRSRERS